jgi:hypothetical protein
MVPSRSTMSMRERAPGVVLFLQPVANPIDCLDQIKGNVDLFELFAQTFDVTIDCAILDIDAVIISGIHEGVAILENPRSKCEGAQNQKFRYRERDGFIFPRARVTFAIYS